jgi:uncharacterized DUF497 family protein
MAFEWDPQKAVLNEAKHGVSFESAQDLDWGVAVTTVQFVGGEVSHPAYVPLGDRLHICVYVDRDNNRRIISLRKANDREITNYLRKLNDG